MSTYHWIWTSEVTRGCGQWVCFRRPFDLHKAAGLTDAHLELTADARYELYVNGQWLGHGPARSWREPWPLDYYDLTGLLREGDNVLAVLVHHPGRENFQYLLSPPGLLATLRWHEGKRERSLGTDAQWRCHVHEGYAQRPPRISIQQGWEEQFDARREPGPGWIQTGFDDSNWSTARILKQPPHQTLEPRDIPFLTREPAGPQRVVNIQAVRPAPYTLGFDLRGVINPADKSANYMRADMMAMTHIVSPRAQKIEIHYPGDWPVEWKLNGQKLAFADTRLHHTQHGVERVRLHKGVNTLAARHWPLSHLRSGSVNLWAGAPLTFQAWPDGRPAPTAWLGVGPFELSPQILAEPYEPNVLPHTVQAGAIVPQATWEKAEQIWQKGELGPDDLTAPYVAPLPEQAVAQTDVYALCASERVDETITVRIEQPQALLHDTADWTVIHPAADGADVRVLLDFGREVVGFHEFEIDAPAGTIVDNHNFEFIQPDGRHNLAEMMNNAFRYVCREGVQRYRTFVRRGLRYSWFTLRGFDRPVRIRQIRLLVSTYPQAGRGRFQCSDPLLGHIWQVGAHSLACCSEDTYTDCPTYEQTHWVGDARNESLVDLTVNGDPRLSLHCWRQVARSLGRSPLAESQVPSGWQVILPAWTFLWMRWAGEYYQWTGDSQAAAGMLEDLERNFQGLLTFINRQGLFEIDAWNMFDWAAMDTPARGVVTHQNCQAVQALEETAALARALGDADKTARWSALAARLRRAINRHLWDERHGCYVDCLRADGSPSPVRSQQTQTAASIARVPTGERAERCRAIIQRAPRGFVQAGSPFFMFFLLEALEREGNVDQMVRQIRDYWGPQIQAGATAFWEMVHPSAPRMTRSHCHGWSAAPTYYLSRCVLGVSPLEPGFAHTRIAPQPGGLAWARGTVPTPLGDVGVRWERRKRSFFLEVRLPRGMLARVEPPVAGTLKLLEGETSQKKTKSGKIASLHTASPLLRLEVTAD